MHVVTEHTRHTAGRLFQEALQRPRVGASLLAVINRNDCDDAVHRLARSRHTRSLPHTRPTSLPLVASATLLLACAACQRQRLDMAAVPAATNTHARRMLACSCYARPNNTAASA